MKFNKEEELLQQAVQSRLEKPAIPSKEDIDGVFDELKTLIDGSKRNENIWRVANAPCLADLECEQGEKRLCKHCKETIRDESSPQLCKQRAIEVIELCLNDKENLGKIKKSYGIRYVLYNGYESNGDDEKPADKLRLCPIGASPARHGGYDIDDYDCFQSILSFLGKPSEFSLEFASKLLGAFPSDETSAVYIDYGCDNHYCGWDEGYFYPTFLVIVTDELTVAYASVGFRSEWDD